MNLFYLQVLIVKFIVIPVVKGELTENNKSQ